MAQRGQQTSCCPQASGPGAQSRAPLGTVRTSGARRARPSGALRVRGDGRPRRPCPWRACRGTRASPLLRVVPTSPQLSSRQWSPRTVGGVSARVGSPPVPGVALVAICRVMGPLQQSHNARYDGVISPFRREGNRGSVGAVPMATQLVQWQLGWALTPGVHSLSSLGARGSHLEVPP